MYRKAEQLLQKWKNDPDKRALLVTGARQVGKTYVIRKFANDNYENFVEINFIKMPLASEIFSENLDADTIIKKLTDFTGKSLIPGKTLIFFDEIQECSNARTAIKFLVEDGRFDYIESGVALGVDYQHDSLYTIGHENILHMYPMDFEEFCIANDIQIDVLEYIQLCYERRKVVEPDLHYMFCKLFRYYVVIGGMPAVINTFFETHDILKVREAQANIIQQYRDYISKYTDKRKSAKIVSILDKIPIQLNEQWKRFKIISINKNARNRGYGKSFTWLKDEGICLPCYKNDSPEQPLDLHETKQWMKLFLNDSGLLLSMGKADIQLDIFRGNLTMNMGSILENAIASQFIANGFTLRCFGKIEIGQVDFLIQQGSTVIPVEIKSGQRYKRHHDLEKLMSIEDWGLDQAIVFCKDNVTQEGNITYLPWYMVMFFKQENPE